jgi:CheY-like chemotaxis protein
MAKILIVDDEELDRVLLRAVLEHGGHSLLFAGDGRTAINVFKLNQVDVVVTDIAMPDLNGLRLIQELREEDKELPIIAISGVSAEQLDLAKDYGANFVLYKPVDPQKLVAMVNHVLTPWSRPPDDLWAE